MTTKPKLKIAAALLIFFLIPAAFAAAGFGLYRPQWAFRVTMDGQLLGYVDCPDQYGEIIRAVYQRAEDYWECQLMMNEEVRATKVPQWAPEITAGFVEARIDAMATYTTSGWAIRVNGRDAAYLESEATALEMLEAVKDHYTPQGANRSLQTATFVDDVEIVRVPVQPEELMDWDSAFAQLISGKTDMATHVVRQGETLSSIARSYNTSVSALRRANSLAGDNIGVGQVLHLELSDSALRVRTVEHVRATETIPRPIVYRSNPDISVKADQVIQAGSDGTREVLYKVESINGQEVGREVLEQVVTRQPVTRIIMPGSGYHSLRPVGMFRFPLNSGHISSRFGEVRRFSPIPHRGIDIPAPRGTPIYAAADGVVDRATYHYSWGNYVRIQHSGGYTTLYAHASRFASGIRPGVEVVRGQVIAYVGNTGEDSFGNHLHFEIWHNGNLVNPLNYYR